MIDNSTINDICNKYTQEQEFSGVVLIKEGSKDVFSFTGGYAHRGYKIKNTLSTRFDTASITKLFTAVGILLLVEKNKLSLEDKVLDIIDIGESKISKEITIYQLLTHTSGIGDDADEEAGESYEAIFKNKPNYSIRELADFLPQFIYREPNFNPGQGCRYNNCAYILLGLVIEKLSGMNYRDYLKKNVFDALSMNSTDYLSMDGIFENMAEGYAAILDQQDQDKILGYKKNIYSYPPIGGTDGGAYTTAEDLALFIHGIIHNKLLSLELTKELLTPKVLYIDRTTRSFHKGYGFEFITRKSDNAVYCIKKDGCNAGVSCDVKYYPEADTTIVILANTDACNIWDLSYEIVQTLDIKTE